MPTLSFSCLNCGKEGKCYPSDNKKYCSQKCHYEYRKKHRKEYTYNSGAKEDGFDSLEQFEGYFGSQLKEGESKTGVVYVYEKYKE